MSRWVLVRAVRRIPRGDFEVDYEKDFEVPFGGGLFLPEGGSLS